MFLHSFLDFNRNVSFEDCHPFTQNREVTLCFLCLYVMLVKCSKSFYFPIMRPVFFLIVTIRFLLVIIFLKIFSLLTSPSCSQNTPVEPHLSRFKSSSRVSRFTTFLTIPIGLQIFVPYIPFSFSTQNS